MLVIRARGGQHLALMDLDLTVHEQALLDFEREWWSFDGRKDDLIRERLRLSPSSYYRLLQALLDVDAAADYDPLTVKRLRKRREQRRRSRLEGRRADPGSR
jgi:hypothetical protein